MYYPDLSPIPHTMHRSVLSGKAVGWLSCEYPYPKGKTPLNFLERLLPFCCSPPVVYCGYHDCDFCDGSGTSVKSGDKRYLLGSGDILVFGPDEIYLAPNLIYHYVADHDYLPPAEFISAVLKSPLPDSAEYFARMMEYYHGRP